MVDAIKWCWLRRSSEASQLHAKGLRSALAFVGWRAIPPGKFKRLGPHRTVPVDPPQCAEELRKVDHPGCARQLPLSIAQLRLRNPNGRISQVHQHDFLAVQRVEFRRQAPAHPPVPGVDNQTKVRLADGRNEFPQLWQRVDKFVPPTVP